MTTINTYTAGGLPTKITDPNGSVTHHTYDGRQRLLTTTVDTSGGNYTTTNTYDSAGNLTRVTIPDGTHSDYVVDNAHRPTKFTTPTANISSTRLTSSAGARKKTSTTPAAPGRGSIREPSPPSGNS